MIAKRTGFLLVGVLAIIVVAGVVVVFQPRPITDFVWAITEDESFLYNVKVIGIAQGGVISEELLRMIHNMNGTTIRASIDQLPTLDNILDASSFAREVIQVPKITCTFENGSVIPMDLQLRLRVGLSGCTLPIGGWEIIQDFYAGEDLDYVPSTEFYVANLYEEYLYLHYQWYGDFDDGGGWWGDSSLEDGRALNALWQYEHQAQKLFIELTIIE